MASSRSRRELDIRPLRSSTSVDVKLVKDFLAENRERVELFFLPPYSTELNPDELVWNHVTAKLGKAVTFAKYQLVERAERSLPDLAEAPHTVRGFFFAPTCRYAVEGGIRNLGLSKWSFRGAVASRWASINFLDRTIRSSDQQRDFMAQVYTS